MTAVPTFTCAACQGVFDRDPEWDEDEMRREHERVFGFPPTDADTVCDDCYQKIVAWAKDTGRIE